MKHNEFEIKFISFLSLNSLYGLNPKPPFKKEDVEKIYKIKKDGILIKK